jgi:hypothetical protein
LHAAERGLGAFCFQLFGNLYGDHAGRTPQVSSRSARAFTI